MQMTLPLWRKWRGTKKPLDESERGEWKSWLKAQHSENESDATELNWTDVLFNVTNVNNKGIKTSHILYWAEAGREVKSELS